MGLRDELMRHVLSRLADRAFATKHLVIEAPDGTHPFVIALAEDRLADVLAQIAAVGGAASVFTPIGHDGRCAASRYSR